jgi:hypothetical protein
VSTSEPEDSQIQRMPHAACAQVCGGYEERTSQDWYSTHMVWHLANVDVLTVIMVVLCHPTMCPWIGAVNESPAPVGGFTDGGAYEEQKVSVVMAALATCKSSLGQSTDGT